MNFPFSEKKFKKNRQVAKFRHNFFLKKNTGVLVGTSQNWGEKKKEKKKTHPSQFHY
jgi:hypothetical protein